MYQPAEPVKQLGPLRLLIAATGGAWLAFIAGYIDAVFFRLASVTVTHITGNAARLSGDLVQNQLTDATRIVTLIISFILGAAASGIIVGSPSLRSGRRYGVVLMIESVILAASAATLPSHPFVAASLAASAAGLQNAMASTYMGLIIRTTHLTGIATDIGFHLGCWARGRRVAHRNLLLLILLAAGFVVGAATGSLASVSLEHSALWPIAGTTALVGAAYFLWRTHRSRG